MLEPLLKVLRLSPSLAASLAKSDMYSGITQKLSHRKVDVRLNLLRLVRNILEARETDYFTDPRDNQLRSLLDSIRVLAEKDTGLLVRNLASDLVVSHIDGPGDQLIAPMSAPSGSNRVRSGGRRIYTPPSLHAAVSAPLTPTQAARSSQSAAYIEVAASPKRMSLAHERNGHSAFRPRSRDGSGIPISSPRPVSGEIKQGNSASRSRLPRNSSMYASRPSLSATSAASRSESMMSNKENIGSAAEEFVAPRRLSRHSIQQSVSEPSGTSGVGSSAVSTTSKQKRSRAPSEGKQKWSA